MEVKDTDGQMTEQSSNRPDQGHFAHRRAKMAVMIEEKAFAGNLNTNSPVHGHSTARRTKRLIRDSHQFNEIPEIEIGDCP